MVNNAAQIETKKCLFSDKLFTAIFVLMLVTVLVGGRFIAMATSSIGLGPGWPELIQGGLGFLFMLLVAVRAIQLGKKRNALTKNT